MTDLTHLSLFTGIGGLDLAAEWAGFRTVGQCEWADYPTKVLEKHWPDVPKWRDVRDVTGISVARTCGAEITVISGGFPCQPHSLAGKRLASRDERDLWGEFARIIREVGPRWIVAENVLGLLSSEHGRFFGRVLRDLANMGYDASWGVFSAFHAGMPHERKRVCIVAHAMRFGRTCNRFLPKTEVAEKCFQTKREINSSLLLNNAFRVLSSGNDSDLRGADGIPRRVDELIALGNAVVPQQFFPVFTAIAEIERLKGGAWEMSEQKRLIDPEQMAGLSDHNPMTDVLRQRLDAIDIARTALRVQQEEERTEPKMVLRTEWETPESCPNCMEHLALDWSFCPECGRPTDWSNEPLTLDELREMNGEPVYLSDLVEKDGVWEGWIVFTSCNEYGFRPRGGGLFPIDGYGKTWLVYRHKPEGGANTNA